jgi:hypothetical protein
MTFNVRQPDGGLVSAFVPNWLVQTTVIIGVCVIAFAWRSAYCEQQTTAQRSSPEDGDQRAVASIFCCQGPSEHPHDESAKGEESMLMLFFTGVIAFAAFQTWLVYRDMLVYMSSAKLSIDGVDVDRDAFKSGQRPVFFLRLINAGQVPAENVQVSMGASYGTGETKYAAWNAVLIPANGERTYHLRATFHLPDDMSTLNQENLTIRGTVTYNGKPQSYCYKYNDWPEPRPKRVPVFIPCDHDTGVIATAKATTVGGSSAVGFVGAKAEGGPSST